MMSSSKRPPVPGKEDILNNNGSDSMNSMSHHGDDGNSSKIKASFNETIIAASYQHEHGVSQESSNSSGGFAHLKWNENFAYLMDDMDGIKLFRRFLEDNNQACLIDFRFACHGLKLKFQDSSKHTSSIVKSIYKKYIKGGYIQLKASTKKTLVEALKANNIHEKILDQAREDNDHILESTYYPKFLQSDLFKKYAEYELENSKLSSHSGSSERNMSQTYFKKFIEPINDQSTLSSISFISEDLPHPKVDYPKHSIIAKTLPNRQVPMKSDSLPKALSTNFSDPHLHTSLVSSDVLSLTSDQCTDDAISFTSSSHDGHEYKTKGSFLKHVQRMEDNESCSATQSTSDHRFLPRTQRLDSNFVQASNIARNNPPLFAKILTNKLNEVLANNNNNNTRSWDCGVSLSHYDGGKMPLRRENEVVSKTNKRQLSSITAASRLMQMLNKEVDKGVDEEAHDVLEVQCSNIGKVFSFNANNPSANYFSSDLFHPDFNRDDANQSSISAMAGLDHRGDGGSMLDGAASHSRTASLHNHHHHLDDHSEHLHSTSSLYNSRLSHNHKASSSKPRSTCQSSKTPSAHSVLHTAAQRPFSSKHKNHPDMIDLLNGLSNERNRVQNWVESTKGSYQQRLKHSADTSSDKASTFKKSSSNSQSEHSKRHSIRHKNHHSCSQDKRSETSSSSHTAPLQRLNINCNNNNTNNNYNNHPPPPSATSKRPSIVVGYYFWDEPIPFRTTISSANPTLAQFKNVLTRKGNFRYFFKHACRDFGGDAVNEEVWEDSQVLPLWEGKVLCKIEPVINHHCDV